MDPKGNQGASRNGKLRGTWLSERHLKVIAMLLQGKEVAEIAITLQINRNQIHRWMRRPLFLKELNDRGDDFLDACMAVSKTKFLKTLEFLEGVVDNGDAKPSDRIKAAAQVLGAMFKSHEITVLKKKLAEMEEFKERVERMVDGGWDGADRHDQQVGPLAAGEGEGVRDAGSPRGPAPGN